MVQCNIGQMSYRGKESMTLSGGLVKWKWSGVSAGFNLESLVPVYELNFAN